MPNLVYTARVQAKPIAYSIRCGEGCMHDPI